jgi:hypothetical protein
MNSEVRNATVASRIVKAAIFAHFTEFFHKNWQNSVLQRTFARLIQPQKN